MAIIKISIKLQEPDFEMPEHFGVAPSTLRYLKQQTATEAPN
jgi:hypothetical protein